MTYKIRPIRSTKPGAKPLSYVVEDENGLIVDKFLYEKDAERRVIELNKKHKLNGKFKLI